MSKRVNVEAHPSQLALGMVDSNVLLELFPFALILDHDMRIQKAGEKIFETWIVQNPKKKPQLFLGSRVSEYFKLRRPKGIKFNWETVSQMHLVIFELELARPSATGDDPYEGFDEFDTHELGDDLLKKATNKQSKEVQQKADADAADQVVASESAEQNRRGSQTLMRILLKGQMRYIADLDAIVFLCSPL